MLPLPVAVFDMHGALVARNQAALEILPEGADATALAALIGSPQDAGELLARIAEAGTVSEVRTIATPFGERVHRINARHVTDDPEGVVVMFDDITERRAHERALIAERERLTDFVAAPATSLLRSTASSAGRRFPTASRLRPVSPLPPSPAGPGPRPPRASASTGTGGSPR